MTAYRDKGKSTIVEPLDVSMTKAHADKLFDLLYTQTQEIAKKEGAAEYAALPDKDKRRHNRTRGFFYSNNAKWWIDLFQNWDKGQIDEETIRGHILNYKTGLFCYPF